MNHISTGLILVAVIVVVAFTASGQAPERPSKGFLSVLTKGQTVIVKDNGGRIEISTFANGPATLGHKITEVGEDYLVVEDFAGVTETRIPVYSIKSIVKVSFPKK